MKYRKRMSKGRSKKYFRKTSTPHRKNGWAGPMRGGIRL